MAKKVNWGKVGTDAAGLAIGAVGSGFVLKMIPIKNEKIKAAMPLVLGGFLMTRKPGSFISNVGAGMMAKGASDLAASMGIGAVPIEDVDDVNEVLAILEEQQANVDEGYYDSYDDVSDVGDVPIEDNFEEMDLP